MKTTLIRFSFLLCLSSVIYGQNTPATEILQADPARAQRVCRAFQDKLDRAFSPAKIAGATVGFVLPDGQSCSASAGLSNLETKRKLLPTDPILAGSIGKTFVSALILQLMQEDSLTGDEKIERWLGNKPWFARLPNAHDITLRMLMNHSSGIPNHVEGSAFEKAALKNALHDIAFDDLLKFVFDKKPLFAAGKGFYYADTNYILLAMIAETITGRTMYDEVADRFLKPFKLDHTRPSNKNLDPEVHGYYKNKPVVKDGHLSINPQWEWAGGGFFSTSEDLARWAQYLYKGYVCDRGSLDRLINGTSVGDGKNYGLGVEILNGKWGTSYGHDGEFPGYLSVMRYYPKYGFAVAAQINSDGTTEAMRFIDSAADDFAGLIVGELVDKNVSADEAAGFQAQAEAWLKLVDGEKYDDSWESLSSHLKAKYTRSSWPGALVPFRNKSGKVKKRQLRSLIYVETDMIAVDFDSIFSKLPAATETVFIKREPDGKWRISSYSIH